MTRRTEPVPPLGIGSPVWKWNENRRVYERDENGKARGGPIWREHWQRHEIIAENRVNWILNDKWDAASGTRISKKDPRGTGWGFAFSEEEINRLAWTKDAVPAITEAVRRCSDYDTLRAIADLLHLNPTGPVGGHE